MLDGLPFRTRPANAKWQASVWAWQGPSLALPTMTPDGVQQLADEEKGPQLEWHFSP